MRHIIKFRAREMSTAYKLIKRDGRFLTRKYKQKEMRPITKKRNDKKFPKDRKKLISMYSKQNTIAAKVVL